MISLGLNIVVNLGFSTVVKGILYSRKGGKGGSRTKLLFDIGRALVKQSLYMYKSKLSTDELKKVLSEELGIKGQSLNILSTIITENIPNLLNDDLTILHEVVYTLIGETLMNVLEENKKVFSRRYEHSGHDTQIYIEISSSYMHKLNVSVMGITQLPSLTVPNDPNEDGFDYYPYFLGETSHISNPSDRVVRENYKNKYKTGGISNLVPTIKCFNRVSFIINKPIYYFLINEWEKEDSQIFKGRNLLLDFLDSDTKVERNGKVSHNSTY